MNLLHIHWKRLRVDQPAAHHVHWNVEDHFLVVLELGFGYYVVADLEVRVGSYVPSSSCQDPFLS